jgi:hypothetical protein
LTTNRDWRGAFCGASSGPIQRLGAKENPMMGSMAAFGIAIAGTSLVGYLLMTRSQNRWKNRGHGDSPAVDGSSSTGDSFGLPSWFGGGTGDGSAFDSSGNPGGGDSGGGGDGGGGGD